jgi:hypothetical protein
MSHVPVTAPKKRECRFRRFPNDEYVGSVTLVPKEQYDEISMPGLLRAGNVDGAFVR